MGAVYSFRCSQKRHPIALMACFLRWTQSELTVVRPSQAFFGLFGCGCVPGQFFLLKVVATHHLDALSILHPSLGNTWDKVLNLCSPHAFQGRLVDVELMVM